MNCSETWGKTGGKKERKKKTSPMYVYAVTCQQIIDHNNRSVNNDSDVFSKSGQGGKVKQCSFTCPNKLAEAFSF